MISSTVIDKPSEKLYCLIFEIRRVSYLPAGWGWSLNETYCYLNSIRFDMQSKMEHRCRNWNESPPQDFEAFQYLQTDPFWKSSLDTPQRSPDRTSAREVLVLVWSLRDWGKPPVPIPADTTHHYWSQPRLQATPDNFREIHSGYLLIYHVNIIQRPGHN